MRRIVFQSEADLKTAPISDVEEWVMGVECKLDGRLPSWALGCPGPMRPRTQEEEVQAIIDQADAEFDPVLQEEQDRDYAQQLWWHLEAMGEAPAEFQATFYDEVMADPCSQPSPDWPFEMSNVIYQEPA